jgi:hypothetical protein
MLSTLIIFAEENMTAISSSVLPKKETISTRLK